MGVISGIPRGFVWILFPALDRLPLIEAPFIDHDNPMFMSERYLLLSFVALHRITSAHPQSPP